MALQTMYGSMVKGVRDPVTDEVIGSPYQVTRKAVPVEAVMSGDFITLRTTAAVKFSRVPKDVNWFVLWSAAKGGRQLFTFQLLPRTARKDLLIPAGIGMNGRPQQ